ncbi:hypothetical protein HDU92_003225 [Lobulomyces angularis]|nr:hypothetical protein HDU92_003225 [Lobulomyces angularis]
MKKQNLLPISKEISTSEKQGQDSSHQETFDIDKLNKKIEKHDPKILTKKKNLSKTNLSSGQVSLPCLENEPPLILNKIEEVMSSSNQETIILKDVDLEENVDYTESKRTSSFSDLSKHYFSSPVSPAASPYFFKQKKRLSTEDISDDTMSIISNTFSIKVNHDTLPNYKGPTLCDVKYPDLAAYTTKNPLNSNTFEVIHFNFEGSDFKFENYDESKMSYVIKGKNGSYMLCGALQGSIELKAKIITKNNKNVEALIENPFDDSFSIKLCRNGYEIFTSGFNLKNLHFEWIKILENIYVLVNHESKLVVSRFEKILDNSSMLVDKGKLQIFPFEFDMDNLVLSTFFVTFSNYSKKNNEFTNQNIPILNFEDAKMKNMSTSMTGVASNTPSLTKTIIKKKSGEISSSLANRKSVFIIENEPMHENGSVPVVSTTYSATAMENIPVSSTVGNLAGMEKNANQTFQQYENTSHLLNSDYSDQALEEMKAMLLGLSSKKKEKVRENENYSDFQKLPIIVDDSSTSEQKPCSNKISEEVADKSLGSPKKLIEELQDCNSNFLSQNIQGNTSPIRIRPDKRNLLEVKKDLSNGQKRFSNPEPFGISSQEMDSSFSKRYSVPFFTGEEVSNLLKKDDILAESVKKDDNGKSEVGKPRLAQNKKSVLNPIHRNKSIKYSEGTLEELKARVFQAANKNPLARNKSVKYSEETLEEMKHLVLKKEENNAKSDEDTVQYTDEMFEQLKAVMLANAALKKKEAEEAQAKLENDNGEKISSHQAEDTMHATGQPLPREGVYESIVGTEKVDVNLLPIYSGKFGKTLSDLEEPKIWQYLELTENAEVFYHNRSLTGITSFLNANKEGMSFLVKGSHDNTCLYGGFKGNFTDLMYNLYINAGENFETIVLKPGRQDLSTILFRNGTSIFTRGFCLILNKKLTHYEWIKVGVEKFKLLNHEENLILASFEKVLASKAELKIFPPAFHLFDLVVATFFITHEKHALDRPDKKGKKIYQSADIEVLLETNGKTASLPVTSAPKEVKKVLQEVVENAAIAEVNNEVGMEITVPDVSAVNIMKRPGKASLQPYTNAVPESALNQDSGLGRNIRSREAPLLNEEENEKKNLSEPPSEPVLVPIIVENLPLYNVTRENSISDIKVLRLSGFSENDLDSAKIFNFMKQKNGSIVFENENKDDISFSITGSGKSTQVFGGIDGKFHTLLYKIMLNYGENFETLIEKPGIQDRSIFLFRNGYFNFTRGFCLRDPEDKEKLIHYEWIRTGQAEFKLICHELKVIVAHFGRPMNTGPGSKGSIRVYSVGFKIMDLVIATFFVHYDKARYDKPDKQKRLEAADVPMIGMRNTNDGIRENIPVPQKPNVDFELLPVYSPKAITLSDELVLKLGSYKEKETGDVKLYTFNRTAMDTSVFECTNNAENSYFVKGSNVKTTLLAGLTNYAAVLKYKIILKSGENFETVIEKPGDQQLSVILTRNGHFNFTRGFCLMEGNKLTHYEWLRTGEDEFKLLNHEKQVVVAHFGRPMMTSGANNKGQVRVYAPGFEIIDLLIATFFVHYEKSRLDKPDRNKRIQKEKEEKRNSRSFVESKIDPDYIVNDELIPIYHGKTLSDLSVLKLSEYQEKDVAEGRSFTGNLIHSSFSFKFLPVKKISKSHCSFTLVNARFDDIGYAVKGYAETAKLFSGVKGNVAELCYQIILNAGETYETVLEKPGNQNLTVKLIRHGRNRFTRGFCMDIGGGVMNHFEWLQTGDNEFKMVNHEELLILAHFGKPMSKLKGDGELRIYPTAFAILDLVIATFFVVFEKVKYDKPEEVDLQKVVTGKSINDLKYTPTVDIELLPIYTNIGTTLSDIEVLRLSAYKEEADSLSETFDVSKLSSGNTSFESVKSGGSCFVIKGTNDSTTLFAGTKGNCTQIVYKINLAPGEVTETIVEKPRNQMLSTIVFRNGITNFTRGFCLIDKKKIFHYEWVRTGEQEFKLLQHEDSLVAAHFGRPMKTSGLNNKGQLRIYERFFSIIDLIVATFFVMYEKGRFDKVIASNKKGDYSGKISIYEMNHAPTIDMELLPVYTDQGRTLSDIEVPHLSEYTENIDLPFKSFNVLKQSKGSTLFESSGFGGICYLIKGQNNTTTLFSGIKGNLTEVVYKIYLSPGETVETVIEKPNSKDLSVILFRNGRDYFTRGFCLFVDGNLMHYEWLRTGTEEFKLINHENKLIVAHFGRPMKTSGLHNKGDIRVYEAGLSIIGLIIATFYVAYEKVKYDESAKAEHYATLVDNKSPEFSTIDIDAIPVYDDSGNTLSDIEIIRLGQYSEAAHSEANFYNYIRTSKGKVTFENAKSGGVSYSIKGTEHSTKLVSGVNGIYNEIRYKVYLRSGEAIETLLEKPNNQELSVILKRNGLHKFSRGFVLMENESLSHYEWLRTGEEEFKLVNHDKMVVIAHFGHPMNASGFNNKGEIRVYPLGFYIVDLILATFYVSVEKTKFDKVGKVETLLRNNDEQISNLPTIDIDNLPVYDNTGKTLCDMKILRFSEYKEDASANSKAFNFLRSSKGNVTFENLRTGGLSYTVRGTDHSSVLLGGVGGNFRELMYKIYLRPGENLETLLEKPDSQELSVMLYRNGTHNYTRGFCLKEGESLMHYEWLRTGEEEFKLFNHENLVVVAHFGRPMKTSGMKNKGELRVYTSGYSITDLVVATFYVCYEKIKFDRLVKQKPNQDIDVDNLPSVDIDTLPVYNNNGKTLSDIEVLNLGKYREEAAIEADTYNYIRTSRGVVTFENKKMGSFSYSMKGTEKITLMYGGINGAFTDLKYKLYLRPGENFTNLVEKPDNQELSVILYRNGNTHFTRGFCLYETDSIMHYEWLRTGSEEFKLVNHENMVIVAHFNRPMRTSGFNNKGELRVYRNGKLLADLIAATFYITYEKFKFDKIQTREKKNVTETSNYPSIDIDALPLYDGSGITLSDIDVIRLGSYKEESIAVETFHFIRAKGNTTFENLRQSGTSYTIKGSNHTTVLLGGTNKIYREVMYNIYLRPGENFETLFEKPDNQEYSALLFRNGKYKFTRGFCLLENGNKSFYEWLRTGDEEFKLVNHQKSLVVAHFGRPMRTSGINNKGEFRIYSSGTALTDLIFATFFVVYEKCNLDKMVTNDSVPNKNNNDDYPSINIDLLPVYDGSGKTLSDTEVLRLGNYAEDASSADTYNCKVSFENVRASHVSYFVKGSNLFTVLLGGTQKSNLQLKYKIYLRPGENFETLLEKPNNQELSVMLYRNGKNKFSRGFCLMENENKVHYEWLRTGEEEFKLVKHESLEIFAHFGRPMKTSGLSNKGEMRVYHIGTAITDLILASFFVNYENLPYDKINIGYDRTQKCATDVPSIDANALPVYDRDGKTLSDVEVLRLGSYMEEGTSSLETFNFFYSKSSSTFENVRAGANSFLIKEENRLTALFTGQNKNYTELAYNIYLQQGETFETLLEKPGSQQYSVILYRNGKAKFTRGFCMIENGTKMHYEWVRTGEEEFKLLNHENLHVVAHFLRPMKTSGYNNKGVLRVFPCGLVIINLIVATFYVTYEKNKFDKALSYIAGDKQRNAENYPTVDVDAIPIYSDTTKSLCDLDFVRLTEYKENFETIKRTLNVVGSKGKLFFENVKKSDLSYIVKSSDHCTVLFSGCDGNLVEVNYKMYLRAGEVIETILEKPENLMLSVICVRKGVKKFTRGFCLLLNGKLNHYEWLKTGDDEFKLLHHEEFLVLAHFGRPMKTSGFNNRGELRIYSSGLFICDLIVASFYVHYEKSNLDKPGMSIAAEEKKLQHGKDSVNTQQLPIYSSKGKTLSDIEQYRLSNYNEDFSAATASFNVISVKSGNLAFENVKASEASYLLQNSKSSTFLYRGTRGQYSQIMYFIELQEGETFETLLVKPQNQQLSAILFRNGTFKFTRGFCLSQNGNLIHYEWLRTGREEFKLVCHEQLSVIAHFGRPMKTAGKTVGELRVYNDQFVDLVLATFYVSYEKCKYDKPTKEQYAKTYSQPLEPHVKTEDNSRNRTNSNVQRQTETDRISERLPVPTTGQDFDVDSLPVYGGKSFTLNDVRTVRVTDYEEPALHQAKSFNFNRSLTGNVSFDNERASDISYFIKGSNLSTTLHGGQKGQYSQLMYHIKLEPGENFKTLVLKPRCEKYSVVLYRNGTFNFTRGFCLVDDSGALMHYEWVQTADNEFKLFNHEEKQISAHFGRPMTTSGLRNKGKLRIYEDSYPFTDLVIATFYVCYEKYKLDVPSDNRKYRDVISHEVLSASKAPISDTSEVDAENSNDVDNYTKHIPTSGQEFDVASLPVYGGNAITLNDMRSIKISDYEESELHTAKTFNFVRSLKGTFSFDNLKASETSFSIKGSNLSTTLHGGVKGQYYQLMYQIYLDPGENFKTIVVKPRCEMFSVVLYRNGTFNFTRGFCLANADGFLTHYEWIQTAEFEFKLFNHEDRVIVSHFGKPMVTAGIGNKGQLRIYPAGYDIADLVVATFFVTFEKYKLDIPSDRKHYRDKEDSKQKYFKDKVERKNSTDSSSFEAVEYKEATADVKVSSSKQRVPSSGQEFDVESLPVYGGKAKTLNDLRSIRITDYSETKIAQAKTFNFTRSLKGTVSFDNARGGDSSYTVKGSNLSTTLYGGPKGQFAQLLYQIKLEGGENYKTLIIKPRCEKYSVILYRNGTFNFTRGFCLINDTGKLYHYEWAQTAENEFKLFSHKEMVIVAHFGKPMTTSGFGNKGQLRVYPEGFEFEDLVIATFFATYEKFKLDVPSNVRNYRELVSEAGSSIDESSSDDDASYLDPPSYIPPASTREKKTELEQTSMAKNGNIRSDEIPIYSGRNGKTVSDLEYIPWDNYSEDKSGGKTYFKMLRTNNNDTSFTNSNTRDISYLIKRSNVSATMFSGFNGNYSELAYIIHLAPGENFETLIEKPNIQDLCIKLFRNGTFIFTRGFCLKFRKQLFHYEWLQSGEDEFKLLQHENSTVVAYFGKSTKASSEAKLCINSSGSHLIELIICTFYVHYEKYKLDVPSKPISVRNKDTYPPADALNLVQKTNYLHERKSSFVNNPVNISLLPIYSGVSGKTLSDTIEIDLSQFVEDIYGESKSFNYLRQLNGTVSFESLNVNGLSYDIKGSNQYTTLYGGKKGEVQELKYKIYLESGENFETVLEKPFCQEYSAKLFRNGFFKFTRAFCLLENGFLLHYEWIQKGEREFKLINHEKMAVIAHFGCPVSASRYNNTGQIRVYSAGFRFLDLILSSFYVCIEKYKLDRSVRSEEKKHSTSPVGFENNELIEQLYDHTVDQLYDHTVEHLYEEPYSEPYDVDHSDGANDRQPDNDIQHIKSNRLSHAVKEYPHVDLNTLPYYDGPTFGNQLNINQNFFKEARLIEAKFFNVHNSSGIGLFFESSSDRDISYAVEKADNDIYNIYGGFKDENMKLVYKCHLKANKTYESFLENRTNASLSVRFQLNGSVRPIRGFSLKEKGHITHFEWLFVNADECKLICHEKMEVAAHFGKPVTTSGYGHRGQIRIYPIAYHFIDLVIASYFTTRKLSELDNSGGHLPQGVNNGNWSHPPPANAQLATAKFVRNLQPITYLEPNEPSEVDNADNTTTSVTKNQNYDDFFEKNEEPISFIDPSEFDLEELPKYNGATFSDMEFISLNNFKRENENEAKVMNVVRPVLEVKNLIFEAVLEGGISYAIKSPSRSSATLHRGLKNGKFELRYKINKKAGQKFDILIENPFNPRMSIILKRIGNKKYTRGFCLTEDSGLSHYEWVRSKDAEMTLVNHESFHIVAEFLKPSSTFGTKNKGQLKIYPYGFQLAEIIIATFYAVWEI